MSVEYLKKKLISKQARVNRRYDCYAMKYAPTDRSPIIPDKLKHIYKAVLGWNAKAVDSLADRLVFREFRHDDFDLTGIFTMNNPDIFFDSAILSALIASCAFIYISPDASGFPRLQVIDGGKATGELDPITGLLTEGYAILKTDDKEQILLDAYFEPGQTTYYDHVDDTTTVIQTNVAYPLLVPIIHRPDAVRPFGRSRITRACMNIQNAARETMTRAAVTAEFYSFPQKYVLGTSDTAEALDSWQATVTSLLEITKDDDGDKPTVGSFPQQNMEPHISQLRMYASLFAGETGLTLDDLGFSTDNPASSEAIKAQHENLRLMARKAQRSLGSGLLNAGFVAACLRDDLAYSRERFYETKAVWEPIFEPDFSAISAIGDGLQKLSQSAPGYLGMDNLQDMTGIAPSEDPFPPVETGGGLIG